MTDDGKTRNQLLIENTELRQRLAQLQPAVEEGYPPLPTSGTPSPGQPNTAIHLGPGPGVGYRAGGSAARAGSDGFVPSGWWTQNTGGLICRHATGPNNDQVVGWRLAPGQGIVGQVALTGRSLLVPDTQRHASHFQEVDRKTGLQSRCILSVPMRVLDSVIGVIQVLDSQTDCFTRADIRLVESLAATASLAIRMAHLYEQTDRLRAFNQSIVQSMKEGGAHRRP